MAENKTSLSSYNNINNKFFFKIILIKFYLIYFRVNLNLKFKFDKVKDYFSLKF